MASKTRERHGIRDLNSRNPDKSRTVRPADTDSSEAGNDFVDIRTLLQTPESWDNGRWMGKAPARVMVEHLQKLGYTEENQAPDSVLDTFAAEQEKKKDKREDGPADSKCAELKCTSSPEYRFRPFGWNIIKPDGSVLAHGDGPLAGKPIRDGHYRVEKDGSIVGPVCQRDKTILKRTEVRFYDREGAERVAAAIKGRYEREAALVESSGNSVRRRPPVMGSRKTEGWSPRRGR